MLSRDCPDCCISGHDCLSSLRGMQGDARLCRLFSVLDFDPGILLLYLLPFLVAFLSMWFFTIYTCAVTMDLGEAAASRPACVAVPACGCPCYSSLHRACVLRSLCCTDLGLDLTRCVSECRAARGRVAGGDRQGDSGAGPWASRHRQLSPEHSGTQRCLARDNRHPASASASLARTTRLSLPGCR